MLEFYKTIGGRKFIDRTVPTLVEEMKRLNEREEPKLKDKRENYRPEFLSLTPEQLANFIKETGHYELIDEIKKINWKMARVLDELVK
ncbi:hypothetical protein HXA34_11260 [Salipaludibacillus agaradhaerens]|jgi:hypothetical protein|uniref:hypothetical protein n=1 Tax=Salipaludibacillus agaradhaerens TaxID=76935 RepID=UPI002150FC58|nr:hypothetical protein [Salipaludibacillus agaradhaerens]MCR6106866.1 hypothetical protein [Salipaludibacillus agaradhaerens]MCR6118898.1 hypothetical protein [Salipaludibacillus agaradhaerens]